MMNAKVVGAALALLAWPALGGCGKGKGEHEAEPDKKAAAHADAGKGVVALDAEALKLIAIRTEAPAASTFQPEVVAYGRFQEDPARAAMLRAPVAGTLRRAEGRAWPSLGETLPPGAEVGQIEPRLSPAERVDLASKLVAAKADAEAATASSAAARSAWERAKTLNAEDKNVSDRVLQEAEAKLKGEEARLKAETETVRLIEVSLSGGKGAATGSLPLVVEGGGDVVEVLAQPGEAVEGGQPLLKAARFDRLLARVAVPPGEPLGKTPAAARIVPIGREDEPLPGERIALDAAVDPAGQGQVHLFRVAVGDRPIRPGTALTAYLPAAGEPLKGVLVPRSAVVRWGGKAWVYVQLSGGEEGDKKEAAKPAEKREPEKKGAEEKEKPAGRFARREIALDHPAEKGWFVTSGVAPGDPVVVTGAQALLSEELKSLIQAEAE